MRGVMHVEEHCYSGQRQPPLQQVQLTKSHLVDFLDLSQRRKIMHGNCAETGTAAQGRGSHRCSKYSRPEDNFVTYLRLSTTTGSGCVVSYMLRLALLLRAEAASAAAKAAASAAQRQVEQLEAEHRVMAESNKAMRQEYNAAWVSPVLVESCRDSATLEVAVLWIKMNG